MKTPNFRKSLLALGITALVSLPAFAQSPAPEAAPKPPVTPPGQILPLPDRSTPVGATIAGNLVVSSAVSSIESSETKNRTKLLDELTQRVNSADQQLSQLKAKATNIRPEQATALNSAWGDYEKAKNRFQRSMENARSENDKTWEDTRAGLAADYAFLASAVAGVEVALPD